MFYGYFFWKIVRYGFFKFKGQKSLEGYKEKNIRIKRICGKITKCFYTAGILLFRRNNKNQYWSFFLHYIYLQTNFRENNILENWIHNWPIHGAVFRQSAECSLFCCLYKIFVTIVCFILLYSWESPECLKNNRSVMNYLKIWIWH